MSTSGKVQKVNRSISPSFQSPVQVAHGVRDVGPTYVIPYHRSCRSLPEIQPRIHL